MARARLPFFDESSEPLEERIATGLHKLGLAMKHESWVRANEEGMSPTQGQILATLAAEGALSGSELAKRIGVSLPTISDSVRALVEKGLATKGPDPRHPRASLVALTATGRAQADKTRSWPEFLAAAVSALSEPEQHAFHTGLVKMIRTLQDDGRIPTSRMCVNCTYFRPNVHEGELPHHCDYVDAPMASRHLRLDCAEQEELAPAERTARWEAFLQRG